MLARFAKSRRARRVGLIAGFGIAAAAVAVAGLVGLAGTTSGRDTGNIETAVRKAIIADNTATMLPPGLRPGLFGDAERQTLRTNVHATYAEGFRGTALTRRLTGVLAWVNRIATDPTEARLLKFRLVDLAMDPPIMAGDSATVTGTYTIVEQQGFDLANGKSRTWGGTYQNQFAYQMERLGGSWFVTDFTDAPLSFTPDPALESGTDLDPAPDATKPALPSDPIPAQPNPVP